ncbi:MFS transporter [Heliobacterium gestii]|uniref:MFS transporter n=2 Tax=Heliomicrobium gestii TaxID=2699 RepID=A0A845LCQ2_HELGE|nr:DHA1 family multidrug resistance protein-like MFS transporter [Heliomicrobium gestii]MZP44607.1 MFS transporter [Heliomicrobium gestii]
MVEKTLLLFGLFIITMSLVTNVYQMLTLRMLQGLCGGFSASVTALAVSMAPKEKIPSTVGLLQTSLIVGGATGPMIGGVIADHFGYRQPFLVFGGLCILSFIVIHFSVKETFSPSTKAKASSLKETFHDVWSLTDLKLMLLVLFLTQFAINCIGPILPLYIQQMGASQENLASISGIIIAIAGLTSAIASASMGMLSRRFSPKQILVVSSLLGGISFFGQLVAHDLITLAVLRAINGLCIGAMIPTSNTIVTYLIPESKQGAAFGITSGASLMGNLLGPLSAGILSMVFGLSSIFWSTALLFFFVSLLLFMRQEARPDTGLEGNRFPSAAPVKQ